MAKIYDIGDTDYIYESIAKFTYLARLERSQLYGTLIKMFLMMEADEMPFSVEELQELGKKYYIVYSTTENDGEMLVSLKEKDI